MAGLTGYHCLAPDLPGFGRSNRVPWRSRIDTTELVADLIERGVPARRAHVVGLSLGGSVAHTLLAKRPALLDRVVIDGCGVLPWRGTGLLELAVAAVSPLLHTRPVIAAVGRRRRPGRRGQGGSAGRVAARVPARIRRRQRHRGLTRGDHRGVSHAARRRRSGDQTAGACVERGAGHTHAHRRSAVRPRGGPRIDRQATRPAPAQDSGVDRGHDLPPELRRETTRWDGSAVARLLDGHGSDAQVGTGGDQARRPTRGEARHHDV